MGLFGDGDRRELEKKAKAEGRLPPGQSLTLKWPALHYGSVPHFDAGKWGFKISGLVEEQVRLTGAEFRALPQTEVTSDFHSCDALEPAGQPLEGRAVYGSDEAGEDETGGTVRAGAGGRRLHGKCAAGGLAAAGYAVYV